MCRYNPWNRTNKTARLQKAALLLHSGPNLLREVLHVSNEQLWLFPSREVSALVVAAVPNEVSGFGDPVHGDGCKFLGMP